MVWRWLTRALGGAFSSSESRILAKYGYARPPISPQNARFRPKFRLFVPKSGLIPPFSPKTGRKQ